MSKLKPRVQQRYLFLIIFAFHGIAFLLLLFDQYIIHGILEIEFISKLGLGIDLFIIASIGALVYSSVKLQKEQFIETREQKQEIERLLRQNQLILNSVSEGIYGVDTEGITIFWNHSAEQMTGWYAEELLGREIDHIIHHTNSDGSPNPLKEGPIYQTIGDKEQKIIKGGLFWRKDGTRFPVEYTTSPIMDDDGHFHGAVITFTDISKQKKTEELMRKSEKLSAIGQLAAGVAHEIRNPLTSLKGFLKLLKTNSSKEQHYLEIMQQELGRIEFIVNEFLFVSKPQAIHFAPRSIDAILFSTIELMQPQTLLNNIIIHTDIPSMLPLILCDEHQLKQVFINIVKNASESMPDGGNINIEARHEARNKLLAIRFIDHGGGIAPDRLPKLGEPFYSTKEKGTGLGLMVSYRIIEAHRGTMNITSKLDKGTTVEILLPEIQIQD